MLRVWGKDNKVTNRIIYDIRNVIFYQFLQYIKIYTLIIYIIIYYIYYIQYIL